MQVAELCVVVYSMYYSKQQQIRLDGRYIDKIHYA